MDATNAAMESFEEQGIPDTQDGSAYAYSCLTSAIPTCCCKFDDWTSSSGMACNAHRRLSSANSAKFSSWDFAAVIHATIESNKILEEEYTEAEVADEDGSRLDVPLPSLDSERVVDEPSPGARSEHEEVPNTPQMAVDEGSSDESGDEEVKKGAQLFWHDHMIMALIDIMKEEHHRVEQEPDHARKESDKTKFERIRDFMKEQGIQLKPGQLTAKWTHL
ncbi:hypothetical protein R1flu_014206 [Riccia fluitans]|uniref:Uncharacterized protein n=1 Tax=Riccia fluitans TaxID=41844 RepID=A0ABD1YFS7_9MARC